MEEEEEEEEEDWDFTFSLSSWMEPERRYRCELSE